MSKYRKLVVGMLICLMVFSLSGCKGKSDDVASNTEGKGNESTNIDSNQLIEDKAYMEVALEEKVNEAGVISIKSDKKGALIGFYKNKEEDSNGYVKLDGKGKELARFTIEGIDDGSIFDFDKDGNMFVLNAVIGQVEEGQLDSTYQLLKGKFGENKFEEVAFSHEVAGPLGEVREDLITDMKIDGQGNFYIAKGNGSIELYNSSYAIENVIDAVEVAGFDIDEAGMVYAISNDHGTEGLKITISKIDPSSQEIVAALSFEDKLWINGISYNNEDKKIYINNEGSIYTFNTELEEEKLILDMNELSQFQFAFGVIPLVDANIYSLHYSNDALSLVYYGDADESTLAERAKSIDKTTITVQVMLDINGIYKKAAAAFERANPELKVEIIEFGKLEAKEYTEKLNLKMMAGEGADMFMDDFPLVTYAQKGYLVDLETLIKNDTDFSYDAFNKEVIDATKIEGSLYAFPLRYFYYINIINKNLMEELNIDVDENWTLEDFEKVIEGIDQGDKKYSMFDVNFKGDILNSFLINLDDYIDYENKTADFTNEKFSKAVELTKKLKNGNYASEDINMYTTFSGGGEGRENILIFPFYMMSYAINSPFEIFEDSFEVWKSPGDEGFKMANMRIAINSNSKNQEACWDFIKFMISKEGQEVSELTGLSIENGYRKSLGETLNKRIDEAKATFPDAKNITDEEIALIEGMSSKIGKQVLIESTLSEAINEELTLYFDDAKSLEDTVKTIQNKVDIYLNE